MCRAYHTSPHVAWRHCQQSRDPPAEIGGRVGRQTSSKSSSRPYIYRKKSGRPVKM